MEGMEMRDKLVKKAEAADPKAVDAAKGAAGTESKAAAGAKRAAAGAVPVCVSKAGELAKKAYASVMKCVGAVIEAELETIGAVKDRLEEADRDLARRNERIMERFEKEWENYCQDVCRGVTGKRAYFDIFTAQLDFLNLVLQMRKAVVEEYPILGLQQSLLQGAYQENKDQFLKYADTNGNSIYNKGWPILSDFVGGLFHASDMGEDQGAAAAAGSFLNGVIGEGVLGTVDGIAGIVTDPWGAVEGVNNVIREPDAAAEAAWNGVEEAWVNGSLEDRCRLAGAAVFEIASTFVGLGAAKASKAAKTAKAAGAAKDMGSAAKTAKTAGALEGAGSAGGASGYYDNLVKKPKAPMGGSGVKINKTGGGDAGPGTWEKTNEAMSAKSRDYQKYVTGAEDGMVYRVNGVKFDGYQDGVLIEAKGDYSSFVDKRTGKFRPWFKGKDDLAAQAKRQVNAADGTKIQWVFNDEASLNATKALFKSEGISEIECVLKPME